MVKNVLSISIGSNILVSSVHFGSDIHPSNICVDDTCSACDIIFESTKIFDSADSASLATPVPLGAARGPFPTPSYPSYLSCVGSVGKRYPLLAVVHVYADSFTASVQCEFDLSLGSFSY
ncbi:hypothetical protein DY000_02033413 [Brassica cretica]|uniref:Xylanase inhibitor N-terminal domain-containing protein n=1 Tax=Brassica cretica TaxID=69181 RepID=A0ABQ7DDT2_BRACR|nr:hypothetical protein DY000_02033413 [Brassica cretica]